ncbi:TIGR02444 family protein [Aliiglaciecola litoralis]|uniref:TIGR02444 family protein n=1 Tax=Aliiglaciecola litoralis TaxID=582857 RepID=A0ABP3WQ50_9ALTE
MLSSEDFWHYSIRVYSEDAVKQLCLRLQDEAQLNVNLLLLCGYLDNSGVYLSAEHFNKLQFAIKDLDALTQSVRAQRKAAKEVDQNRYQQLLEHELQYEQQQQQLLIETVQGLKIQRHKQSNFDVYYHCLHHKGDPNLQKLLTTLQLLITDEKIYIDD